MIVQIQELIRAYRQESTLDLFAKIIVSGLRERLLPSFFTVSLSRLIPETKDLLPFPPTEPSPKDYLAASLFVASHIKKHFIESKKELIRHYGHFGSNFTTDSIEDHNAGIYALLGTIRIFQHNGVLPSIDVQNECLSHFQQDSERISFQEFFNNMEVNIAQWGTENTPFTIPLRDPPFTLIIKARVLYLGLMNGVHYQDGESYLPMLDAVWGHDVKRKNIIKNSHLMFADILNNIVEFNEVKPNGIRSFIMDLFYIDHLVDRIVKDLKSLFV